MLACHRGEIMMPSGPPIFIGGLMKSGTSLLRKLLSRHPHIFGGLETHWFAPELTDDWRNSSSQRQTWLRDFFDVSERDFARIKSDARNGREFFTGFMDFCTQRAGKDRWVEKTPDNVLHMRLIWENWPDAKFLHMIRDPRAVYASWKRSEKGSLQEFVQKTQHVLQVVGQRAGSRDENYLEVRYERLVEDTRDVLTEVLDFVGEPWVKGLDQYEGDAWDHRKVLSVTGKEGRTTESLMKPIFTSAVDEWKDLLGAREVSILESEMGAYLDLWGWD